MRWQRRLYERRYRRGTAPWDTGVTPPEVVELIEGDHPPTGRALDLGCGTGTNVAYLAAHGFEVVGIDFSRPAIERARARLAGVFTGVRAEEIRRRFAVPFGLARVIPGTQPPGAAWYLLRRR